MKIQGYDIDLDLAVKTIKNNNYKKVLLQIPEGLKGKTSEFVEYFESETNANVIIYGDPCFGACDIPSSNIKNLNIDLIIHIGHLSIPEYKISEIPVLFLNAEAKADVTEIVEKALPSVKGKKIGIVTTAQHIQKIKDIKKIIEKNGFTPIIGKGDKRIHSPGQILGCNYTAATSISTDVDIFLYIGSGNFHPLGLKLSTKKDVITCDPFTGEIKLRELDDLKETILRQRYGAISRSEDAKTFGILVGTKTGQQRMKLAIDLKKILDAKGKKTYIITTNHFTPSHLESFRNIDCFVSTACPRIAIDDYMQYKKPILTPMELKILIGLVNWDDYQFDEILN